VPRLLPLALLLIAPAIALAALPALAQEREGGVTAEITVFEAQATLDPAPLSFRERQRLRPEQILVLEGGVARRVTNLEPLGSGSWRILVYVDGPLSRPRTVRLATLRLGSDARRLTDLGTVEVVVADPEPRTVIGPTRDPVPVADALSKIGEAAGTDRIQALRSAFGEVEPGLGPGDARRTEALGREVELVRQRVDHLLLQAARGCEGDPCALFLVSDGFHEDPATFYLGEKRLEDPSQPRPAEDASRELAQTLAAYEWIAIPLPLRGDRLEAPAIAQPRSDFDVFLDHTGAVRPAPKRSDREPVLDLESLEVSVTPVLQPLQRLAVETAGQVVRVVDDVEKPIENLADRRRVYYLTDRSLDGDVRQLSARLVENGTALRTPSWVRSSTPTAVAAARMRALLAGAKLQGEAPLRARIERGAAGETELVVEANWKSAGEIGPKSPIRVSVGYARSGELPWVAHQRLAAGEIGADGAWSHRLAVRMPEGVDRVMVLAEALGPRIWGAAIAEAPR
jgi:hypothetical protein